MYVVSLLVPCRNNPEQLAETLDSALDQTLPEGGFLEVIVVDGSSDGGCRREVERRRWRMEHRGNEVRLDWIWRPARGVYDALNTALKRSEGRWLQVLPAGDRHADRHSLERLLLHFKRLQSAGGAPPAAVFGQSWVEVPGARLRWLTPHPRVRSIHAWLRWMVPCHQSLLFDGDWARAHPYPEGSAVYGDRPVMRAALAYGRSDVYLAVPVCRFRLGGISSGLPDRSALRLRLGDPALAGPECRRERIKALMQPIIPAALYAHLMRLRAAWLGWRC